MKRSSAIPLLYRSTYLGTIPEHRTQRVRQKRRFKRQICAEFGGDREESPPPLRGDNAQRGQRAAGTTRSAATRSAATRSADHTQRGPHRHARRITLGTLGTTRGADHIGTRDASQGATGKESPHERNDVMRNDVTRDDVTRDASQGAAGKESPHERNDVMPNDVTRDDVMRGADHIGTRDASQGAAGKESPHERNDVTPNDVTRDDVMRNADRE